MHLTHINLRHRFTQVLVFCAAVFLCLLFSQAAFAQRSNQRYAMDKKSYRVSVHKSSHRVCYVLWKKRTSGPKHSMFALNSKKGKQKMQLAETDEPARIAGAK